MEKTTTEIATTELDDRLSSLPDEVVTDILSFLETKYAVGTAVLSRRWKDLWTRVSNLDFDNSLIHQPLPWNVALHRLQLDERKKYLEVQERRLLEFCRFVCKVLSRHKNLDSVRRFRFHCTMGFGEQKVSPPEWVFGPLVEEIDMMLHGETDFPLPRSMRCLPESFYTLKNLKVVKLQGVILSAAAKGSVLLPCVNILQLCEVEINDVGSLSSLISGCPVLETALIEYCSLLRVKKEDILVVSLPSLKNLTMNWFRKRGMKCPIVLEAPNLEELDLKVFAGVKFMGNGPLSCLHSAGVDIARYQSRDDSLAGILSQISNAKKMCLSFLTLSHPSIEGNVQYPHFPNLTHLTIHTGVNSRVLHSLLNSAPKLHSLVIDKKQSPGLLKWERLEHLWTPKCLLSSLEEIEFKDLIADENEIKMVAYLLEAGVVLKKVNIHVDDYALPMEGRKNLASLLKLPRGSSCCEARVFLPNNKEILVDNTNETDIDDDMDDDDFEDIVDQTDNKV